MTPSSYSLRPASSGGKGSKYLGATGWDKNMRAQPSKPGRPIGSMGKEVAIVTGGGRGVGRGIVHRLAREGICVVVADLDPRTAEEVAAEVLGFGGVAVARGIDIADQKAVANLARFTQKQFGRIDILVNNAALFYKPRPAWEVDQAYWRKMFAVNVEGTLSCCRAVTPMMRTAGGGRIVNLSSVMYVLGNTTKGVYQTSKGAINALTRALALELARYNIRVNAVAPGSIETPRTVLNICTPEYKAVYLNTGRIPLRRVGQPADIASVVFFLISEASVAITGQVLIVDGGYSLTL